jgi:hypothetical protein
MTAATGAVVIDHVDWGQGSSQQRHYAGLKNGTIVRYKHSIIMGFAVRPAGARTRGTGRWLRR